MPENYWNHRKIRKADLLEKGNVWLIKHLQILHRKVMLSMSWLNEKMLHFSATFSSLNKPMIILGVSENNISLDTLL